LENTFGLLIIISHLYVEMFFSSAIFEILFILRFVFTPFM